ncbi:CocE/NonD family hydrolase [Phenylobacterium sp.]|uniref:CocE/NonD family hydrolase n=1 Tax=Phenylobacterium sp. TaxID=1871053 RepID=UPI002DF30820|nr:CocE/NonD family hydrolase [Phenylobacterium sp.]
MRHFLLAAAIAALSLPAAAQTSPNLTPPGPTPPTAPDITGKSIASTDAFDFVKREVMIPMRDGVKLHTVIVTPKGGTHLPILLTRTPYNATKRAERSQSPYMVDAMPQGDEPFMEGHDYIRVFQDVRGKYGSQGDYIMTRPLVGPLNDTKTDHSTDAWDTIDWLVKNVPETNGKVGMIGSSYEGFTVVMALVHPHPALKVAAPESPMVDGWMGDDWFHYGAFRQPNFDYITGQTTKRDEGEPVTRAGLDDYANFLAAGSAGDFAHAAGLEQYPFWRKILEHPAYDAFWQAQALDKVMGAGPLTVPVMWEQGLWDQEDMWGANHSYAALEPKDVNNDKNYLVIGPWRHSGVNYEGRGLGPLKFEGDTALQFRRDVLKPFFDQYLKDGAPRADTPPVLIYRTGLDRWDRLQRWPLACETACPAPLKPLYLQPGGGLGFERPAKAGSDEYVSDPAKPVPFVPRPVVNADRSQWQTWLVRDQRFVDGRPDVLTYETGVLSSPVQISGAPVVNLFAATSGTDGDWVVKLIDVYPGEVASQAELGGYELPIAMDIFRGRYRESFSDPKPIAPGKTLRYRFVLPNANHVFLPGHRIMVQVQSSWFPLYDRNPQTFTPNIFLAKPADYRKATERVFFGGEAASAIELPVVPFTGR